MARKNDDTRKDRKKLTLSKETIRDLTPTAEKDLAVRGGIIVRRCSYVESGCAASAPA